VEWFSRPKKSTQNQTNRTTRAKQLRRNSTRAETILWNRLRAKQLCGIRFRRQQRIGTYIVDIYCPSVRLVIELDGVSHEGDAKALSDRQRQVYLEMQGLKVLRFFNDEIYNNTEGVLETIAAFCQTYLRSNP